MLQAVVQHQGAALLPAPGFAGHADRTVARRDLKPEVTAQVRAWLALVRLDPGAGA